VKEIRGNFWRHSTLYLLSANLLSKNIKIKINRTKIVSVVWCGCETWSHTLTQERKLRMSENRVLRKIFGAKRDEVTGEWRKLHKKELYALYFSPDIIWMIK